MTNDEIRAGVLATAEDHRTRTRGGDLQPDRPLRDQVDLDSMDWLNFLVGLHQRLKVDIPESDYRKLTTFDGILAYLAARLG